MSYLLDTHILLWWLADDPKLGKEIRNIIAKEAVWVSTAAVWEIIIKKRIGKLEAPDDIDRQLKDQNFAILDIKLPHVIALGVLADHHADPFDRIQIAQSQTENLVFITRDRRILKYGNLEILPAPLGKD